MKMNTPRICLVSEDLSLPPDEGIKKLVLSLREPLGSHGDVLCVSTRPRGPVLQNALAVPTNRLFVSRHLARVIGKYQPDILIYVPESAATRNAFIRCAILRQYAPRATIGMISLQPRDYGPFSQQLIHRIAPDLVVVQSPRTRDSLLSIGCRVGLIPSGIDLGFFRLVSRSEKLALREKYGLPHDAFVVVHVGHFKSERNVLLLNRIRSQLGCETVMVGSSSEGAVGRDSQLRIAAKLRDGGTRVVDTFVERVGELYQVADCYLFPGREQLAAIEMPLSVLEAMACGLPVVSTPFGPLPMWFGKDSGITFASSDDDLVAAVGRLQNAPNEGTRRPEDIRAQVERFAWPAVARSLISMLQDGTVNQASEREPESHVVKDVERCAS